MRVLIVDDELDKLARIRKIVQQVDVSADVVIVQSVAAGMTQVKLQTFDLVVVDVMLPLTDGQPPVPDGGARLLSYIDERTVPPDPSRLIALTQYDALKPEVTQVLAGLAVTTLHYRREEDAWESTLADRAAHLLRRSTANSKPYAAFMCVVCALHDPELQLLLHNGWEWARIDDPADATLYYEASIPFGGASRRVVAASACRPGLPDAAVLASKMVTAFRPRYLSMCGISAGFRGNSRLGDVIVADPCWDYGSGKWVRTPDGSEFRPAPYHHSLDPDIRHAVQRITAESRFKDQLWAGWSGSPPAFDISVRIGPMAAGAAVLSDGATISRIAREQHRKLLAVDMESYAIFAAAAESPLPRPRPLVVKTIVDYGDDEKADDFQRLGSHVSAMIITLLAESGLQ